MNYAALLVALIAAAPLTASPRNYALDIAQSDVKFAWDFGQDEVKGTMPVASAALSIDFANVANSHVDVSVDVTGAEAGFPFASQAMKGPKVLNAAEFPQIKFISNTVRRQGDSAAIDGNITVRGVTRPMHFDAQLFRPRGSQPDDLSNLSVVLVGALNRSEFGAGGWSDMAGDQVRLKITAFIYQAN